MVVTSKNVEIKHWIKIKTILNMGFNFKTLFDKSSSHNNVQAYQTKYKLKQNCNSPKHCIVSWLLHDSKSNYRQNNNKPLLR